MRERSEKTFSLSKYSIVIISLLLITPALSFGSTYWVSPTGTASWGSCKSITPLSGTAGCSLATANMNAVAGDTIYLRGGTYASGISPSNSGTGVNSRIVFAAASGETPIISASEVWGVFLRNKHYIKVEGITVQAPIARLLLIQRGSSYNEISNCTFNGVGSQDTPKIWDGDIQGGEPCRHNWIHGTTFEFTGSLGLSGTKVDDWGGMQLGVPAYDSDSGNNTIENCVFRCGGHHNLETFTKFNVIRNNFFHHEGCMPNETGVAADYGPDVNGLWGNRNLQIYDGYGEDGKFNLIEGNRFGPSGPPPDDDGGDGLTLTAPKNIVRYNEIYGAQNNGLLMKMGWQSASNNNRVYNNTIFKSGRYRNTGPQWQGTGIRFYPSQTVSAGNAFVNNIIVNSHGADVAHARDSKATNTFFNNWYTSSAKSGDSDASPYYGDPMFVDVGMDIFPASRQRPDLSLKSGSGAIDAGAHLTRAKGDGGNSTRLVVEDALFFQDGSWGSNLAGHQADWIAVGSVDKVVQIASIDYSSNTISLSYPISWSDGDRIWLYQKSDGARVLYGCSPDIGAKEFSASGPCGPVAPQSLRLVQ